ncbi:hypothetical protein HMPREF0866_00605 [Ruminococcaceae bacterium D16]|nr:hypothetical protein HMPREF0866_00605 [Ruminococcaceae bacterium D16]
MAQYEVSDMEQMTWEEYYDGFYGWSPSTQKSYAYRLSSFGSADEVWEIAEELDFNDSAFAARFLEKAFSAGVRFTPEQVLEMVAMVDQSLLSKMAEQTAVPFNREQLEEIYMMIDDSSFRKISKRSCIDVFDDVKELRRQEAASSVARLKKKGGLLSAAAAIVAGVTIVGHINKKHDGHCDGDCANCPPHYGYRYGRWYYGKGHQCGCEFGGNKGDGSL